MTARWQRLLVARSRFRAMSTDMAIVGVGVSAAAVESAAARATRLAEAWEAAFSRFRPDSELSRLNGSGGRPTRVSAMFLEVLDAAIAAAVRSCGRFDPTVLPSLEAAGYDQTIERVRGQELSGRSRPSLQAGAVGIGGIEIDRGRLEVTLAPGIRLDLGGIAKGAFADRIADELRDWPGGCVDAGGDLRVWGTPPSGPHWLVGVEDPWRQGSDLLVAAIAGPGAAGVASSSVTRRRWIVDGVPAHHLLDPRTGQPLGGAALAATAFAATTAAAEVATKELLVAASRGEPLAPLDAAAAVVIGADGRIEIRAGVDPDACRFYPETASRRSA